MATVYNLPHSYTEDQKKLLLLRERISELCAAEARLEADLRRQKCDHPRVIEYSWEWDDGYGHQKKMVGHACYFCDAKKPYPDSSIWVPVE